MGLLCEIRKDYSKKIITKEKFSNKVMKYLISKQRNVFRPKLLWFNLEKHFSFPLSVNLSLFALNITLSLYRTPSIVRYTGFYCVK